MKNLLGYMTCVLIAILLSVYINGSGGILVLCLLLLALGISMVILFMTKRRLAAGIKLSTDIAGKGESVEAEIILFNAVPFLPSCVIEVVVECSQNIQSEAGLSFKTVVIGGRQESVNLGLKTRFAGLGYVKIKSVLLHDYLGIAALRLDPSRFEKAVRTLRIMPNIPDAGTQSEILRATSENSSYDDNESESDETALGLTGVPGYDHRPYEVGDPLKRINWKLSSKKDELMVRLDEKVTASSQAFFLDIPECKSKDVMYAMNVDVIMEASLAMLAMLIGQGYESEYNYFLDGWKNVTIKQYDDLIELQNELSAISPYPEDKRFEFSHEAGKTAPICFTSCTSAMSGEFGSLLDEFSGSFVVTRLSGIEKITENMWQADESFEFRKMS